MNATSENANAMRNITELLIRCGVSPEIQGFDFLAKAVLLYSADSSRSISDIYTEIGDEIGYPETKVHRYADYAILHAPKLSETINAILGTDYVSYRLHNKLAVALLSICYKKLYLAN